MIKLMLNMLIKNLITGYSKGEDSVMFFIRTVI